MRTTFLQKQREVRGVTHLVSLTESGLPGIQWWRRPKNGPGARHFAMVPDPTRRPARVSRADWPSSRAPCLRRAAQRTAIRTSKGRRTPEKTTGKSPSPTKTKCWRRGASAGQAWRANRWGKPGTHHFPGHQRLPRPPMPSPTHRIGCLAGPEPVRSPGNGTDFVPGSHGPHTAAARSSALRRASRWKRRVTTQHELLSR